MNKEATLKNKIPAFFVGDKELSVLIPLHKWLLISASVLVFLILPLIFVWSSLGLIHPRGYEQGTVFLNTAYLAQTAVDLAKNQNRQQG